MEKLSVSARETGSNTPPNHLKLTHSKRSPQIAPIISATTFIDSHSVALSCKRQISSYKRIISVNARYCRQVCKLSFKRAEFKSRECGLHIAYNTFKRAEKKGVRLSTALKLAVLYGIDFPVFISVDLRHEAEKAAKLAAKKAEREAVIAAKLRR